MPAYRVVAAMAGCLLAGPTCAAAPPGEATASDATISVTARRLDRATIRTNAQRHIQAVLPVPVGGQYGRWTTPVCARVNGLQPEVARIVTDKFAEVARAAKAPLAAAGCKPNVVIVFTTDAGAVAQRLAARRPRMFERVDSADRQALFTASLPVRWWSTAQIENADGVAAGALGSHPNGVLTTGEQPTGLPGNGDTVTTGGYSSSLIDTHARVSAVAGTVLVDVDLATGYKLDAVAAYVSMAVLAQARLRGETDPELSILGLFKPGAARRDDLSDWDRAFLAALYRIPLNRSGLYQRGAILAAMTASLAPN